MRAFFMPWFISLEFRYVLYGKMYTFYSFKNTMDKYMGEAKYTGEAKFLGQPK